MPHPKRDPQTCLEADGAAVSVFEDVGDTARRLRQLHARWSGGADVSSRLRPVVAQAWRRVTPDLHEVAPPLGREEIRERQERAGALTRVLPLIRQAVLDLADQAGTELVVCDAGGVVLWQAGPWPVRRLSDRLGFVEGARWREQDVGVNALGTAMVIGRPVQIFGAEHSDPGHHGWVCTGAPLTDRRTGRTIGAFTLSGPLCSAHPFTLSLVRQTLRQADRLLNQDHAQQLQQLANRHWSSSDRRILVDAHGWVADGGGATDSPRLVIPPGTSGQQGIWVPEVGWCQVDEVAGGFELRPSMARVSAGLRMEPAARLEIRSGNDVHCIPLTARQSDLLHALAVNPKGLDATGLRDLVYPAGTPLVTVRAEMSRLRRTLGSLVLTRPYRLAVECNLLQPC